jgi:hypothetical protein
MCRLGKVYKQKGMYDGPAIIVEKTHPHKEGTTKVITMYTRQILSDESVGVEHEPRSAKIPDRVFSVYDWGVNA